MTSQVTWSSLRDAYSNTIYSAVALKPIDHKKELRSHTLGFTDDNITGAIHVFISVVINGLGGGGNFLDKSNIKKPGVHLV